MLTLKFGLSIFPKAQGAVFHAYLVTSFREDCAKFNRFLYKRGRPDSGGVVTMPLLSDLWFLYKVCKKAGAINRGSRLLSVKTCASLRQA